MRQEGYTQLAGEEMGFLLLKVPQEILSEIKISVDEIQNDFTKALPYNQFLAGQIEKEYFITLTNKVKDYIKWTVAQFNKVNPKYIESVMGCYEGGLDLKYEGKAWVNFQKKYEYNPLHNHGGVISYVIWYQIPFYKDDEIKYGAGRGKRPHDNNNGEFEFIYHNGTKIVSRALNIDKTMEGYIAIFPSNLNHIVYPFYTSDDYRITVSSNIPLQY